MTGRSCDRRSTTLRLELAGQVERDEQTVDDQGLDERQGDDHRDEDLSGGLRVARDTVERGGSRAPLTESTAEGRETDGEGGAERDEAASPAVARAISRED